MKISATQDVERCLKYDLISEQEIDAAIYHPDTSSFIRTILLLALDMDPVDAVNHVETVSAILARRAERLSKRQRR